MAITATKNKLSEDLQSKGHLIKKPRQQWEHSRHDISFQSNEKTKKKEMKQHERGEAYKKIEIK